MKFAFKLAAVACAVALAACGGGGGSGTVTVRSVGDSLMDVGTFGYRFSVQGIATEAAPTWTERVTSALGAVPLCPRNIVASATSVVANPNATQCTAHGVGSARINPVGATNEATPLSVVQQLKDVAATQAFAPTEVLMVDGGGNDTADLFSAFLAASTDQGAAYTGLLGELLPPSRVAALAANGSTGLAAGGAEYMVALANRFADALTTHALNRGAQRVLVLNVPNITLTPRFKAVLAGVAAASGGGSTGAAAAAQLAGMVDTWVKAFNQQVNTRLSSDGRVAFVDFYGELNKWVASPAAYGLTNVTTPACPVTGADTNGLPTYTISACTIASLSAAPQPGTSGPDWWRTYLFSDNFHGTPRTNQLVADVALGVMNAKGWR